jgi:mannitol 2-dehydrogenase
MEEVTPTLDPVEGINLTEYKDTLINRFSNRNIADTILRLCEDGSTKIPNFILKPLMEAIHRGLPHDALVFAISGWARFLTGTDEDGAAIPIKDPNTQALSAAAQKARENPEAFLSLIGIHGLDAAEQAGLTRDFSRYLESVYTLGAQKALAAFLNP